MMNPADLQRRRYLAAMGIGLWEPRDVPERIPAPQAELTAHAPAPTTAVANAVVSTEASIVPAPQGVAGMDWSGLERSVAACTLCKLHQGRTQTVFGVGNRNAEWLFVGEAPGAEEDRQGEPFVGRAGQLLNAMLLALGLQREQVYIANVLKCRPPNNRDPEQEEVEHCEPYLLRQIALIRPRIIVALGRHAAHSLLKTDISLGKLRGQRLDYHGTPLIVTYHPAYLLRNPIDKRKAWDDLRLAQSIVHN